MALENYQKVVQFRDLSAVHQFKVLEALVDFLDIEIIQEATPDYVSYSIRKRTVEDRLHVRR